MYRYYYSTHAINAAWRFKKSMCGHIYTGIYEVCGEWSLSVAAVAVAAQQVATEAEGTSSRRLGLQNPIASQFEIHHLFPTHLQNQPEPSLYFHQLPIALDPILHASTTPLIRLLIVIHHPFIILRHLPSSSIIFHHPLSSSIILTIFYYPRSSSIFLDHPSSPSIILHNHHNRHPPSFSIIPHLSPSSSVILYHPLPCSIILTHPPSSSIIHHHPRCSLFSFNNSRSFSPLPQQVLFWFFALIGIGFCEKVTPNQSSHHVKKC